jgi:hypothetical protein
MNSFFKFDFSRSFRVEEQCPGYLSLPVSTAESFGQYSPAHVMNVMWRRVTDISEGLLPPSSRWNSKSKSRYDRQSVNSSCCRAPFSLLFDSYRYVDVGRPLRQGMGLPFVCIIVWQLPVCAQYLVLHVKCMVQHITYAYTIYTRPRSVQAQYNTSCHILNSSRYNDSLVT